MPPVCQSPPHRLRQLASDTGRYVACREMEKSDELFKYSRSIRFFVKAGLPLALAWWTPGLMIARLFGLDVDWSLVWIFLGGLPWWAKGILLLGEAGLVWGYVEFVRKYRPIKIDTIGISSLFFGRTLCSIKWADVIRIERTTNNLSVPSSVVISVVDRRSVIEIQEEMPGRDRLVGRLNEIATIHDIPIYEVPNEVRLRRKRISFEQARRTRDDIIRIPHL
jgi:hypothetical protein